MIRQLGMAILNVCSVVPDGVVVFFPSYGYLDEVVGVWQAADPSGGRDAKTVWERLATKKIVLRETKGGSSDEILREYSTAILGPEPADTKSTHPELRRPGSPSGALLLSVVGGKMSEGINFSDRLGRCVIIVGLPYPNANSPEWKARREYLESSTMARLTDPPALLQKRASGPRRPIINRPWLHRNRQPVTSTRMPACDAVNQSIGRAIRHRGDYASIILVDRRFSTERIRSKLPGWIRGGMAEDSETKGLQGMMGALNTFFRGKREAAA